MKRILMDLHPCFDAFAGIPQDTRVTFGLLSESTKFAVGGHLYHSSHGTTGFPWENHDESEDSINQMAEYVIALNSDERRYDYGVGKSETIRAVLECLSQNNTFRKLLSALIGKGLLKPSTRLNEIDSSFFQDYLWRGLFEKSLSPKKRDMLRGSTFVGGSISRGLSNKVMLDGWLSPTYIDTKGWDFYLSQTGMPANVSPSTKLLIRFHDAVPIQYPNTIDNPYLHHQLVKSALKLSLDKAHFICNSESTREQLISIYPSLEDKSDVVYCCVPDEFRKTNPKTVKDIVAKRTNPEIVNAREFSSVMKFKKFVESRFNDDFFIAVGTIEPRKNYSTIIEAWNRFRKITGKETKLVIVGNRGWGEDSLYAQISGHSHDGDLFLLQNVSTDELIDLYSMAKSLIVASYTEGFSYSGIEAMRCETPVIASDISVHREVYGDNANYFDPYDKAELVEVMKNNINASAMTLKETTERALDFSLRYSEGPSLSSWDRVLGSLT